MHARTRGTLSSESSRHKSETPAPPTPKTLQLKDYTTKLSLAIDTASSCAMKEDNEEEEI
jgi:hypothetical protein